MNNGKIQQRMEKLSAEIDRLRYEYHVLDKPEATLVRAVHLFPVACQFPKK